ncbi:MAG TPA: M20/M25/M40 family metallo-hydrolase [Gemmatimonadaceae bacterium]|nr:M20/M25/M40 family metallo-hydrolase [Gemmatimonadaceae bacterium]
MQNRLLAALALIALCAISVYRTVRPPAPVPATAPDTVFSAERAMRHVEAIAVRPHPMGTAEHDRVRDYIVGRLTALGLAPQIQTTTAIGTRYQEAGRVQNILAWLPGADAQRHAVLLVVHYDGVPAGPAAADDGAGVAALLETLRALRARKQPLAHDVIALFTDGEEAGLLGASAFVREHPWARDVDVVLNFEARGTTGRSYMFETGPGNLDAVRMLRAAGDVTAGSIFTTVYRALPNDTDLSELSVLGTPALNFAFADGVERYHTTHDDVQFLNPGSVQHHGQQMLALAKRFADDSLPRPKTGDAVFFDMPLIGLIVYPVSWALPLAILALVLFVFAAARVRRDDARWLRGAGIGFGVSLVAVLAAGVVAALIGTLLGIVHAHLPWGGWPAWSGLYAAAIALVAIALVLFARAAVARWSAPRAFQLGAAALWTAIAAVLSVLAPATTYLFIWPVLFALVAIAMDRAWLEWLTAIAAILIGAGFSFAVGAIMLGLTGAGAFAFGLLVALIAVLVLPLLLVVFGDARFLGAPYVVAAGALLIVVGLFTVRWSDAHPVPTALVYLEHTDSTQAGWLSHLDNSAWSRRATGASVPAPAWATILHRRGVAMPARRVAYAPLDAPTAAFIRDTVIDGARRIVVRVHAPRGTTALLMDAAGAHVVRTAIDDRVADTTRLRRPSREWSMNYWAVPDSGAVLSLAVPPGASLDLDLAAERPGLPALPGVSIPARPSSVVPIQSGDATIVYARFHFP